jgi:hypothetical protein
MVIVARDAGDDDHGERIHQAAPVLGYLFTQARPTWLTAP